MQLYSVRVSGTESFWYQKMLAQESMPHAQETCKFLIPVSGTRFPYKYNSQLQSKMNKNIKICIENFTTLENTAKLEIPSIMSGLFIRLETNWLLHTKT